MRMEVYPKDSKEFILDMEPQTAPLSTVKEFLRLVCNHFSIEFSDDINQTISRLSSI